MKFRLQGTQSCQFAVTVYDVTPPVITCPANVHKTTSAGLNYATVVWSAPPATDNSGIIPTVVCSPAVGMIYFGLANTSIECNATGVVEPIHIKRCLTFYPLQTGKATRTRARTPLKSSTKRSRHSVCDIN